MNTVVINAQIQWMYRHGEGGKWVAVCEDLGLAIQSERFPELHEDIGDALDLLFHDLLNSSELDDFLTSHGWTRTDLPAELSDAVFEVPYELLMAGKHGSETSFLQ
jgi:hypothetical protein